MLVDVEEDAYRKKRKGGVFLYQVCSDEESWEPLVQIQYIDGDDFGMRELGDIYINNAELCHYPEEGIYRLYLSQMTRGLLIL